MRYDESATRDSSFWLIRMNAERNIASSDTVSVRNVKGNLSNWGPPGTVFNRIQDVNQMTWTQTNVIDPQKAAIA